MASRKKKVRAPKSPPKTFYVVHDGTGAIPAMAYEDGFDAGCEAQELAESEGVPWYVAKVEVVEPFSLSAQPESNDHG